MAKLMLVAKNSSILAAQDVSSTASSGDLLAAPLCQPGLEDSALRRGAA